MLQSSKGCCRSPSKALKPLLGLLQSMQWWVPFQGFISLSSLLHMVMRQPCWLHTKFVHGKFAEFFWSVLAAGYMGAQARLHGNSRIILWIASARITPCTKGACYLSLRECITDVALEFFSHSSPPHFSPWNCESHPKLRKSFIYHLCMAWCPTSRADRAAKFTKNKNDQWNHAGGFSISICAGLSLKMQPRKNWLNCRARCIGSEPPKCRRLHASGILRVKIWKG